MVLLIKGKTTNPARFTGRRTSPVISSPGIVIERKSFDPVD
jgi:hypothetical protein